MRLDTVGEIDSPFEPDLTFPGAIVDCTEEECRKLAPYLGHAVEIVPAGDTARTRGALDTAAAALRYCRGHFEGTGLSAIADIGEALAAIAAARGEEKA